MFGANQNLMIFPTKDVDTNIDEEFAAAVEYLPNVCPSPLFFNSFQECGWCVTDTAFEQSLPANAQFCSVKVIDFGFCEEVQPGQLLERFSGSEAYVAPGAFLLLLCPPLLAQGGPSWLTTTPWTCRNFGWRALRRSTDRRLVSRRGFVYSPAGTISLQPHRH